MEVISLISFIGRKMQNIDHLRGGTHAVTSSASAVATTTAEREPSSERHSIKRTLVTRGCNLS
jgi:hypothetical protein